MYKRILEEAPMTPTKKVAQSRFVVSPIKLRHDNYSTTYMRDIRDPEDHSLLGVTLEGVYDIRFFLNGMQPVKDDDGKDVHCQVSGVMIYDEKIHTLLLERMGLQNFTPKFLTVVKEAGINKATNVKGKRYLFFVPVHDGGNSFEAVEKFKATIQSLHDTEYVNENGQTRRFGIVNLPSTNLEIGQEAGAFFHISKTVLQRLIPVKEEKKEIEVKEETATKIKPATLAKRGKDGGISEVKTEDEYSQDGDCEDEEVGKKSASLASTSAFGSASASGSSSSHSTRRRHGSGV